MTRPSEPLLKLLRRQVDARGHNTASLAAKIGRPRGEVRRMLSGADPMTLDDLLTITQTLELSAEDLGLGGASVDEDALEAAVEGAEPLHWGNQPEALFRLGYDMGMDFLVLVDTAQLAEWGGPDAVLEQHQGKELPIQLLAEYHRYQDPEFTEDAVTITLSFDKLHRCTFPWSSIRRMVFQPLPPERSEPPEEEKGDDDAPQKGPPHLRLVT